MYKLNSGQFSDIATLIAQILEYYYKKYAFLILESAKTEMVVFGFCYRNKKFVAYHLKPEIIENKPLSISVLSSFSEENFSTGSDFSTSTSSSAKISCNTL